MRKIYRFLYLSLLAAAFACGDKKEKLSPVLQAQADSLYSFELGGLQLKVSPKIGGRVVSLQLGGQELLSGKATDAINFGSTLWPSPQTLWNWPPLTVLDAEPYTIVADTADRLVLVSAKDPVLGLQFGKTFFISTADTAVHLVYSITNLSDTVREVAPWEITRVPKGGLFFFPQGVKPLQLKNASMDMMPFTVSDGIYWYKNEESEALPKSLLTVGDGAEGWVAYAKAPLLFIKKYGDKDTTQQAKGEAEVEGYVSQTPYIEVEVQGPVKTLQPGESTQWEVVWFLKNIAPEQVQAGSLPLAEKVRAIVK